jgi:hypothetical protein
MILFFLPALKGYISRPIMDLTFNYSPGYAYDLLEALGSEGRNFYIFSEFLDFIYLAIYSIFFTLLMAYMFKKAGVGVDGGFVFKLVLLTPVVGFFDLLENICFLSMLFNFPERHDNLAVIANVFTLSKWIIFYTVCLVLLALIVLLLFRSFRKSQKG